MGPKVSPRDPPRKWIVKPASAKARKQWEEALVLAPELMHDERERLVHRPLDRGDNPRRTHQLKGELAQRRIGDRTLDQWQHELSGPGRIWYCPDKKERVIWVTRVSLNHPKETD